MKIRRSDHFLFVVADQSNTQVHFRTFPHHRISAQSGSTAYSSMRSESMNMEYPSNHSSFVRDSLFVSTLKEFFN